jgi:hypothetical protein
VLVVKDIDDVKEKIQVDMLLAANNLYGLVPEAEVNSQPVDHGQQTGIPVDYFSEFVTGRI